MLKIPAETQTGKLFRIRGKGVKSVRGGGVGDLLCRVIVETPVALSKSQKERLREFGESLGGHGGRHSPARRVVVRWCEKIFRRYETVITRRGF